jgi:hypothetical protein
MIPDLPNLDNSVEVEDEDGAQASEASDSAESKAETDTQGFEKPMTFGSFDL